MDKQKAQDLINKYLNGTCTPEEKLLVEKWYNNQIDDAESVSFHADLDIVGDEIFQRVIKRGKKKNNSSNRLIAAAIVLMILSFGINYYYSKQSVETEQHTVADIEPGGNKAYLTLNNGEKISLTDAENGDIENQSGITITKTDDGQLVYSVADKPNEKISVLAYNTISTPKGGQFKVILPDGSNVWLNAESSLTYPTTFSSLIERRVELKGEAFFEVAHNKEKPFIVHTIASSEGMSQDVEVLGTHFNINSYENEDVIKTTLLEGAVRIKTQGTQVDLKPKQQSRFGKKGLNVVTVDTEEAVAWKNGYFMFDDEGLESIMRKIARWYDVDVEFHKTDRTQVFSGTISKFTNVKKVLNKLELTGGVHFEIEGRRIIVK